MAKNYPTLRHGNYAGNSVVPEYRSWYQMMQRCFNPNYDRYPYYGGRGITVCQEWRDYSKFLADMGSKPTPKHTIERICNDGPYCKINCKWATRTEQARNRRSNLRLTINGETRIVVEWAELAGIEAATLLRRLRHGCPPERLLDKPQGPKCTCGQIAACSICYQRERRLRKKAGLSTKLLTAPE